jgi:hypothetical protein
MGQKRICHGYTELDRTDRIGKNYRWDQTELEIGRIRTCIT